MSGRRLRFALFGCGDFGPVFAPYILEIAELVAICDPSPAARSHFAQTLGRQWPEYDEYEKLLESEQLDAVAIASPNYTHRDIAVAAARRGLHVYCEKPMAISTPECWEMVRACEVARVRLMVGHKRRLRPPWARMIELCEQLGPALAITSCQYYDSRPYRLQGWWTRAAQSGGLLDIADVHILDWMRAMCGNIRTVRAVSAPQVDQRFDYPDTMHVELQFHSGTVASLNASLSYPLLKFREAGGPLVICRAGGMRFVPFLDHIDLYWQHSNQSEPHHERFDDLGFQHAYRRELGDFVRWVQEGTEPCLTWREGLRCVEAMEAAHRSAAENGSVIRLPLYPELELPLDRSSVA
jgi:predicted dehydrogenase